MDVKNYVNWTDLARPELKGKLITYPFNDSRGHFVFAGFVNQLVKEGKAPAPLYSQPAWEAGFKWWKDNNMEGQILKWGDIGNDPIMRGYLQQGTSFGGCTWGVYSRELVGLDWNVKDDVLAPFYPKTGMVVDRETLLGGARLQAPGSGSHPHRLDAGHRVQHRRLVQGEAGRGAKNHWNITPDKFLVSYCGGTFKEMRDAVPDQFKQYFNPDPAAYTAADGLEMVQPELQVDLGHLRQDRHGKVGGVCRLQRYLVRRWRGGSGSPARPTSGIGCGHSGGTTCRRSCCCPRCSYTSPSFLPRR